jgi:hypothetical protein
VKTHLKFNGRNRDYFWDIVCFSGIMMTSSEGV